MNPAGSFNGTGTVAVLTFNVTDVGTCTLFLDAELASDARIGQSRPIDHQTLNGYFGRQPTQELDWKALVVPVGGIAIALVLIVVFYLKKKKR
jgi:hypothetical protein